MVRYRRCQDKTPIKNRYGIEEAKAEHKLIRATEEARD
jgi:hypothetical protein